MGVSSRLDAYLMLPTTLMKTAFFFCSADDFESKYSFHPVEDFPAPEEFKHFQRIYPSKTNRATRGAPPLPPIPR
ncbi:hypothetical protein lerEdw1_017650 [Lerista edwardsae]|nr:hypothetical protein lerEdw1_017650 [Lerista edwardsae]